MTFADFEHSLALAQPPTLQPLLEALWWEARGDWNRAHDIAQDDESPNGAWVHAFLHRREGDPGNAAYWYRRSGRPVSRATFPDERREIVTALLAR